MSDNTPYDGPDVIELLHAANELDRLMHPDWTIRLLRWWIENVPRDRT